MSIPDAVTKDHVLKAIAELNAGASHPFGNSNKHELLHGGRRYPADAVIGLAARHATGQVLSPDDLAGPEDLDRASEGLRQLGFEVVTVGGVVPRPPGAVGALDPRVVDDIKSVHERMVAAGELLTSTQLDQYYGVFRERFGPAKLSNLDGEALLQIMHDHSNRESLVYWLEFKDDEEFPSARFGSIAGGSALKFGLYRRRETGKWMTGSSKKQREITTEEAVGIARNHRDQLLQGVQLLEGLPSNASDAEYKQLQLEMNRIAPDVGDSAWGHKYFSLLFPDKLDDYHSPDWQQFHLIALLQIPPAVEGRYAAAGRYVAMARHFGIPLHVFTTILNRRTPKHAHWRIGTSDGKSARNRWDLMRDGNCVAIGWSKLGDLSSLLGDKSAKDKLYDLMQERYPADPRAVGGAAQQVLHFIAAITQGDIVVACDGATVLGIGKVTGEYVYDSASPFHHHRAVRWLSFDEWRLPEPEGLRSTVRRLRLYPNNLVAIESHIIGASPSTPAQPTTRGPVSFRLEGLAGRIQLVLDRKHQVILYGPPGTGKTYLAHQTARELAARSVFGTGFDSLSREQQASIIGTDGEGLVRTCCFHPGYGYEDFIEGHRPEAIDGQMHFVLKDGLFKRLCRDAAGHPNKPYYLIIDEINRGDIPRIFGELLHGLELDKRGHPLLLPVSGGVLRIPTNVYLIGTMNTADRSIALLDTALRRRFGFLELMPDSSALGNAVVEGIPLGQWLDALNQRIREHVGRDARNLQVGHAYFFTGGRPLTSFPQFARVLQEDLLPLLQEYCYEDYSALEKILGSGLVDAQAQTIRHELFEDSRREELIQALLATCPDIATSIAAVESEASSQPEDNDDTEESDGENT